MAAQPARRGDRLTVDGIVDTAAAMIAEGGLAALSMRRLGERLGVDAMAVYHHVPNKRALLGLVMERVAAEVEPPAASERWESRVRGWARSYWEVVAANRDLVAASLTEPAIAAGGLPLLAHLTDAVAASGLDPALVEPNAWLVVDAVHGSALAAAAPQRGGAEGNDRLRAAFEVGLDTIVAGIAARARARPRRRAPRRSGAERR